MPEHYYFKTENVDIPEPARTVIPGITHLDLCGDKLHVFPRNWSPEGGASLMLESEDPETDTAVYDLAGLTALRDTLTIVIDEQIAQGK